MLESLSIRAVTGDVFMSWLIAVGGLRGVTRPVSIHCSTPTCCRARRQNSRRHNPLFTREHGCPCAAIPQNIEMHI